VEHEFCGEPLKNKKKIAVFYLPAYSPELNPDEYFNYDLKAGIHIGKPARNKERLKKKVVAHMRMLKKQPAHVMKYLNHRCIQYAHGMHIMMSG